MPIDQGPDEAFGWLRPSGAPRGFETQLVYTCRNAEEFVRAGDSGQTDVIRLSVIDCLSPCFAIRKTADGTFASTLRTIGAASSVGARGIR